MTIRLLAKNSLPETTRLYEIYVAAYTSEAWLLGVSKEQFFPLQQSIEAIRCSKDEIWGLHSNENLIGAVFLERLHSSITISNLVVDPPSFRQGVAKALLKHIFDSYPDAEWFVATGAKNIPAIRLYEFFGFLPVSEEIVEPDIKLVKMKKMPVTKL